jgi:hypothetical protein
LVCRIAGTIDAGEAGTLHPDKDVAPSGSRELRLCLALTAISAVVFVACVPYVRVPLPPSPGFVAVYNVVSILNDLTTSVILFGQFNIPRSRSIAAVGKRIFVRR